MKFEDLGECGWWSVPIISALGGNDAGGWIAGSLRAAWVVEFKASLRYIVKLFQGEKKAYSSQLY